MPVSDPIARTVEFHEIHVRNDQSAWCKLLWNDSGWVIILSDYGHWAYRWCNRGEGVSVPKFLSKLDRDYMGGKLLGADIEEFSLKSTVQAIREDIIDSRRTLGMTKEEARDEWELCDEFEEMDCSFDEWYSRSSMVDGYECRRTEVCGTWQNFWERLWVPLVVPVLQAEFE